MILNFIIQLSTISSFHSSYVKEYKPYPKTVAGTKLELYKVAQKKAIAKGQTGTGIILRAKVPKDSLEKAHFDANKAKKNSDNTVVVAATQAKSSHDKNKKANYRDLQRTSQSPAKTAEANTRPVSAYVDKPKVWCIFCNASNHGSQHCKKANEEQKSLIKSALDWTKPQNPPNKKFVQNDKARFPRKTVSSLGVNTIEQLIASDDDNDDDLDDDMYDEVYNQINTVVACNKCQSTHTEIEEYSEKYNLQIDKGSNANLMSQPQDHWKLTYLDTPVTLGGHSAGLSIETSTVAETPFGDAYIHKDASNILSEYRLELKGFEIEHLKKKIFKDGIQLHLTEKIVVKKGDKAYPFTLMKKGARKGLFMGNLQHFLQTFDKTPEKLINNVTTRSSKLNQSSDQLPEKSQETYSLRRDRQLTSKASEYWTHPKRPKTKKQSQETPTDMIASSDPPPPQKTNEAVDGIDTGEQLYEPYVANMPDEVDADDVIHDPLNGNDDDNNDLGKGTDELNREEALKTIYADAPVLMPQDVDHTDLGGTTRQRNNDAYTEILQNMGCKEHFTKSSIDRAEQVKEIHDILHWSDKQLGDAFDKGIFHNCHLTSKDVQVYRKLYGPCVSCLRGKMTAASVPHESLREPETKVGIKWEMDFQFIAGVGGKKPILTFTEVVSGLIVAINVKTRGQKDFIKAIKAFKLYLIKVFKFTNHDSITITSDQEDVFGLVEKYIPFANLTRVAPDQHAKRIERAHRKISDMMRTIYHGLPYKLPKALNRDLLYYCVQMLNTKPNGSSGTISPNQLIFGRRLSLVQLRKIKFGMIVVAKIPNSQVKNDFDRTEVGIVVGFENSRPENLKVYVPSRRCTVVRDKVVEIPLTPEIISMIAGIDKAQMDVDGIANNMEGTNASESLKHIAVTTARYIPKHPDNMSIKQAIQAYGAAETEKSVQIEIDNMMLYDVFEFVTPRKDAIPSKLFVKAKYDNGVRILILKIIIKYQNKLQILLFF